MKKSICVVLTLLFVLPAFAACGTSSNPSGDSPDKMKLYVLNWGDYIDEDVLAEFISGHPEIEMHYDTTTSNEEMLIQVQNESSIYDLCVPSDYMISKMVKMDLLQPLDFSQIPNFENIDPAFLGKEFDPENRYSVPYLWGTVGIVYNKTMVSEPVDSWEILWDPDYSKQIIMYDSIRDSMAVALKKLGYSMNSTDPDQIAQAEAELIRQKPLVLAYLVDDIRERMISGSAAFGVMYAGDAITCIEENPDLEYVIPKEGSNVWFDNAVLLKRSQNAEAAHIFINYLCDAEVARRNSEYIGYSTPNKAAMEMMDDWNEDPIFNPPKEVVDRCEAYVDLGDAISLYNDAWLRIKGQ
ncbi:MAG: spermidine/putrescine ABC transporter substrate-binding protein [Peptococcaceae bacterium]|jgi:spermidine/putrescine-binding protein|nr:spermidine/putrescine ABC transporter substrate-binding protein [Peptococcaceae bacterium]